MEEFNATAKPSNLVKGWNNVLHLAGSGGTEFGSSITTTLQSMAAKKFNIIIFSDSDLMHGSNWTNLTTLWAANKGSVCFVADEKSTFDAACKQLGQVPVTWTYLT